MKKNHLIVGLLVVFAWVLFAPLFAKIYYAYYTPLFFGRVLSVSEFDLLTKTIISTITMISTILAVAFTYSKWRIERDANLQNIRRDKLINLNRIVEAENANVSYVELSVSLNEAKCIAMEKDLSSDDGKLLDMVIFGLFSRLLRIHNTNLDCTNSLGESLKSKDEVIRFQDFLVTFFGVGENETPFNIRFKEYVRRNDIRISLLENISFSSSLTISNCEFPKPVIFSNVALYKLSLFDFFNFEKCIINGIIFEKCLLSSMEFTIDKSNVFDGFHFLKCIHKEKCVILYQDTELNLITVNSVTARVAFGCFVSFDAKESDVLSLNIHMKNKTDETRLYQGKLFKRFGIKRFMAPVLGDNYKKDKSIIPLKTFNNLSILSANGNTMYYLDREGKINSVFFKIGES